MKKIHGSSHSARKNKRHITMCLLTLALLVLSDSFQGSYQTGMNGHVMDLKEESFIVLKGLWKLLSQIPHAF